MVGLVAYSAWVYPFEVAFMKSYPKRELFIADNIANVFFAIDIILTFFVAYFDSRTQLLVYNSKKIAKRLVSFFCLLTKFNLLCCLTVNVLLCSVKFHCLHALRFRWILSFLPILNSYCKVNEHFSKISN